MFSEKSAAGCDFGPVTGDVPRLVGRLAAPIPVRSRVNPPGDSELRAILASSSWDYEACRILSIIYLFLAFACRFGLKELVIESLRRLGVPTMNFAKYLVVPLALAISVGCAQSLLAQGTDLGTIRGTVTDPSGAMIPNAKVVILDLATNTSRETNTNAQGEYQVFGLRAGRYKVSIGAPGMNMQDITGLVLTGSDVLSANAVLKLSGGQEHIVVTAEAAAINTEDQTISDTIASREVIDLPRDSRDVYSFLYLNPNITQSYDGGTFKFLGFQSYGANFSLDGQRATNTIFGEPTTSEPSLEAVAEVNVLSNDFGAEYAGISNIRITTKRGGSQFHGSAVYDNKNSALAALQIQDKEGMANFVPSEFLKKYPTPYFNYNDIAGSLGGPIPGLKKTWFFTSYERNYSRAPVSVSNNKLPHPAFWTGDFSPLISNPADMNAALLPDVPAGVNLTSQEVAADTYCTGWPNCTGTGDQFVIVPSRLLNPNVQSLISTYFPKISPTVQIDTSTGRILDRFQTILPGGTTRDLATLRVDHDFTDKDRIYVVYEAQSSVGTGSSVIAPFTGLGLTQTDIRDNTLSVSYLRTIRNNLINEVRGGFNLEHNLKHSNTTLQGFLSTIGFDSTAIGAYAAVVGQSQLQTHGHTQISYGSNFVAFGSGGRNTEREQSQYPTTFGDTLTWVIKNHNLKMGADFVRNVGLDGFASGRGNPRGTMTYTNPAACAGTCGGAKTDPFAELLLGLPPTTITYITKPRPPMNVHNWEQGYFFQDDWKVTPKLTLNLGLRYELVSPFVDKNDIMMNFDPTFGNNTGRFIVPSDKTIQYLDPRIPTFLPVVTAAQSGLGIGRGLVRTDKNNFAPRFGFAWQVGEKSVIRGGYGVYFPTSAAQGIRDPLSTNAFNQALVNRGDKGVPLQPWPTPLTGGQLDTNSLSGAP